MLSALSNNQLIGGGKQAWNVTYCWLYSANWHCFCKAECRRDQKLPQEFNPSK